MEKIEPKTGYLIQVKNNKNDDCWIDLFTVDDEERAKGWMKSLSTASRKGDQRYIRVTTTYEVMEEAK